MNPNPQKFRSGAHVAAMSVLLGAWLVGGGLVGGESLEYVDRLIMEARFRDARRLARAALDAAADADAALDWHWLHALACQGEHDHEEALGSFRRVAAGPPGRKTLNAVLEAAGCCLEMSDPDGARRLLEESSRRWDGSAAEQRRELLAITDFVSGRESRARQVLESLETKSAEGWHSLGLIEFGRGLHEKALGAFDRAVVEGPEGYYNEIYRGWCLIELNRFDAGRRVLRRLVGLWDSSEARRLLGRLELRAGRLETARRLFGRALEQSPDSAESQFGLATTLRRLGRLQEARQAFDAFGELHRRNQRAIERSYVLTQKELASGGNPADVEELARHLLSCGDPAAAERAAWRVLRKVPGRVAARLCLARVLASMGRYSEAALHYRRILRRHGNHPAATQELGELIERHARGVKRP